MCLSITNASKGWKPAITVKEILLGIQELLGDVNNSDPANGDAHHMFAKDRKGYDERVREQARKYAPRD